MSLTGTIINMAQNYVGSNNINLLFPSGMFGTRHMMGADAASPRYVYTRLCKITRFFFFSLYQKVKDQQQRTHVQPHPKTSTASPTNHTHTHTPLKKIKQNNLSGAWRHRPQLSGWRWVEHRTRFLRARHPDGVGEWSHRHWWALKKNNTQKKKWGSREEVGKKIKKWGAGGTGVKKIYISFVMVNEHFAGDGFRWLESREVKFFVHVLIRF